MQTEACSSVFREFLEAGPALCAYSWLHLSIDGDSEHHYMPYYAIKEETFTWCPVVGKA
jgi:hypothetical protein